MLSNTPIGLYEAALKSGNYQPDAVQRTAVEQLELIYEQLIARENAAKARGVKNGFTDSLKRWFGGSQCQTLSSAPIKGIYFWGGVGRGKTWLMDLFYHSLPTERKLRLHFHRFMQRVQEELVERQGQEDPLEALADGFKAQADVLCFDEFFVSDITDAMILGTLLEALFSRGMTLIATSNIPPDALYRNGLQRTRFLPAIEQINLHCNIMNVDAGIDYRLRTLTKAHLYLTPLSQQNYQHLNKLFVQLTNEKLTPSTLRINHREMKVQGAANGVLMATFTVLCEEPRNQHDYIELSKQFHTVFLQDVFALKENNENAARRFLALVDEFYERKVKLIIHSQEPMNRLYQGTLLEFEYQRCLSRLQEMQSEEYLTLTHLA